MTTQRIDLSTTLETEVPIELESFPGAGAIWVASPVPAGCSLTEQDSETVDPGVGGPARQRFTFMAVRPGSYTLTLELKRPWESVVRATRQVHIEVR